MIAWYCLPYHFSSPTRFPGCCYGSPSSLHLRKHPLNSIPEIEDAIVTGIAGLAFSRKQTRFSYIFKLEATNAFQPTSNKHGSWLLFCGRQLSSFQRNAGRPPGFPGFVAWQSTMRPTSTEPQNVKSSQAEDCSSIVWTWKIDINNKDIYICLTIKMFFVENGLRKTHDISQCPWSGIIDIEDIIGCSTSQVTTHPEPMRDLQRIHVGVLADSGNPISSNVNKTFTYCAFIVCLQPLRFGFTSKFKCLEFPRCYEVWPN